MYNIYICEPITRLKKCVPEIPQSLQIATRTQLCVPTTMNIPWIKDWWTRLCAANSQQLDQHLQAIIYTAWNLWKERCRSVFDNKAQRPSQLVEVITQDLHDFRLARATS